MPVIILAVLRRLRYAHRLLAGVSICRRFSVC